MGFRINWSALGVSASLICAIHCALMPLLVTSLPLFGVNLIENIWVEISLLVFAFIVGFYSLWHGYRKHHHRIVTLFIFSAGITLFVVHQFVEVPYYGITLILPGVIAVLTAHYLNYRLCRKANHCHSTDCNHE
jgi:hypothetical protein